MKDNQNQTKESLIEGLEIDKNNGSLESSNFELLKKLINNSQNIDEAIKIRELGVNWRTTGLHYQPRLDKIDTNKIHYLSKNKSLSLSRWYQSQTNYWW